MFSREEASPAHYHPKDRDQLPTGKAGAPVARDSVEQCVVSGAGQGNNSTPQLPPAEQSGVQYCGDAHDSRPFLAASSGQVPSQTCLARYLNAFTCALPDGARHKSIMQQFFRWCSRWQGMSGAVVIPVCTPCGFAGALPHSPFAVPTADPALEGVTTEAAAGLEPLTPTPSLASNTSMQSLGGRSVASQFAKGPPTPAASEKLPATSLGYAPEVPSMAGLPDATPGGVKAEEDAAMAAAAAAATVPEQGDGSR
jgi:hypothetical protein